MSNFNDEWNDPEKNYARQLVFENLQPLDTMGTMPSNKMRCILLAKKLKLVTPKTRFLLWENEEWRANVIESKMKREGLKNFHLHRGDAEKMTFAVGNSALNGLPLGLGFLDYCGQLTDARKDAYINEFCPLLGVGSTVALTFSLQVRNKDNVFLKAIDAERLFYAMPKMPENNIDESSQPTEARKTVAAVFAMQNVRHTVDIIRVHCYTAKSESFPMVMIKTKVRSLKPSIHFNPKYLFDPTACHIQPRKNMTEWEHINCHPNMLDKKKAEFVRLAKRGQRPPWMSVNDWLSNSLNPTRERISRAA